MNLPAQPGILQPVPPVGRHLFFALADSHPDPAALRAALHALAQQADGTAIVVGLGPLLVQALGASVPGLREFPALQGARHIEVPATPSALGCWLRGSDCGELVLLGRRLEKILAPALRLERIVEAFRHGPPQAKHGRDLTGYEDGTENPEGEGAIAAALVQGAGPGLDGASFAAMQQWVHDFDAFEHLTPQAQDEAIGRRHSDNEELQDAPASAHVKRTAQESFSPPAFVLRRSMSWALGPWSGLMFVAYGRTLDAFEAQLRRMAGLDDGIADALFGFTRPVSGAYFWCPPVQGGKLDLSAIGI